MGNVWSKYVSDIVHSIEFHSHFSSENISCKKINDIFTGIITTAASDVYKRQILRILHLLEAVGFMPSVLSDCLLLKR